MSIAQKLQDILDCKDAIKTAIAGKGGTITDATPLDEYATAVQSIPSGDDSVLKAIIDGSITEIDIPSGVTKIKDALFLSCASLTRVGLPNTVTELASQCFSRCNAMTSITLPSSLLTIGAQAFFLSTRLASVNIPSAVTSIGASAFQNCPITAIDIPNSVTSIGGSAFLANSVLVDAQIGTGITSIGSSVFGGSRNVIIRIYATTPPTLGTGFVPANYLGKIYVPDASVNDYKTASNWSAWASFIYPLSDYTP